MTTTESNGSARHGSSLAPAEPRIPHELPLARLAREARTRADAAGVDNSAFGPLADGCPRAPARDIPRLFAGPIGRLAAEALISGDERLLLDAEALAPMACQAFLDQFGGSPQLAPTLLGPCAASPAPAADLALEAMGIHWADGFALAAARDFVPMQLFADPRSRDRANRSNGARVARFALRALRAAPEPFKAGVLLGLAGASGLDARRLPADWLPPERFMLTDADDFVALMSAAERLAMEGFPAGPLAACGALSSESISRCAASSVPNTMVGEFMELARSLSALAEAQELRLHAGAASLPKRHSASL